ncbi:MAG TPA: hemerythrin domain-containing protein [Actinomycetota bacterium]|nr:hemerythrin domain-containing protein [Actinomycetota bacterium]
MEPADKDLSEKHGEFVPIIAAIERAEASVGAGESALRVQASDLHESLAHGLIPHAIGEGRTLFPVLRRVTGSDQASAAMNRDHKELARLTDELDRLRSSIAEAGLDAAAERSLTRVLRDLRELMARHFAEEEQVCFQVLKAELSPEEARQMCETMERTAAEVRSLYE